MVLWCVEQVQWGCIFLKYRRQEVEIQYVNPPDTLNTIFTFCNASVILGNFKCFVFKNICV